MVPVRRHARDWRAYLACGGLVVGLLLHPALAETSSQQQGNEPTRRAAGEPAPALSRVAETSSTAFIDADPCPDAKNNHQEDRCISWHAAKAAEDQAWWAKWTFFVGCFGTAFILLTLLYTRRSAEAAAASAEAAERAVAESAKTLTHAQEVAARDLRPWLTLSARLTECVDFDRLDDSRERFEVFVEIRLTNVGKVAAKNVTYSVRGIDANLQANDRDCLNEVAEATIEKCSLLGVLEAAPFPSQRGCDMLAPSETHTNRLYCVIPDPEPGSVWARTPRPVFRLRVVLAVAYSNVVSGDDVFFTAKVFPIGRDKLIQFLDILGRDDIPTLPTEVALGSAVYARAK